MKPQHALRSLLILSLLALTSGCREGGHDHDHHGHGPGHSHTAPHGGVVAVLGQEEFHLELVPDGRAGTLTAYFLDGHMEKFLRVPIESVSGRAVMPGKELALRFTATGSSATGEKPGDTSMFVASADWLPTAPSWDLILDRVEVRGRFYTNVVFRVPAAVPAPTQPQSK